VKFLTPAFRALVIKNIFIFGLGALGKKGENESPG
jgi:hypothetical protein